jgi:NADPH:quinone reductase-like Zn-dependent oxidoreductase
VPKDDEVLIRVHAASVNRSDYHVLTGSTQVKPRRAESARLWCNRRNRISLRSVAEIFGRVAVCAGEHRHLMMWLGADKVIDYKTQDFTRDTERYDFVVDAVAKTSYAACRKLMRDNSVYTSSGGFENLFLAVATRLVGRKRVRFIGPTDVVGNLMLIKDLVEQGRFKPEVDRQYPIEKISEEKIGNVIVTMD